MRSAGKTMYNKYKQISEYNAYIVADWSDLDQLERDTWETLAGLY